MPENVIYERIAALVDAPLAMPSRYLSRPAALGGEVRPCNLLYLNFSFQLLNLDLLASIPLERRSCQATHSLTLTLTLAMTLALTLVS